MSEWRPIATAPKDGSEIEVAWIVNPPTVERRAITHWWRDHWFGRWTPTHWRPIQPT